MNSNKARTFIGSLWGRQDRPRESVGRRPDPEVDSTGVGCAHRGRPCRCTHAADLPQHPTYMKHAYAPATMRGNCHATEREKNRGRQKPKALCTRGFSMRRRRLRGPVLAGLFGRRSEGQHQGGTCGPCACYWAQCTSQGLLVPSTHLFIGDGLPVTQHIL